MTDTNGKEQERGRPRRIDWNVILLAFIAATPPTIMAWRTADKVEVVAAKVEDVRHATNSMKDALVKAAGEKGRAAGVEEEKDRAATEKADRAAGAQDEKARRERK